MNKYLLKIAGLASLVLLLHVPGFAQTIVPDHTPTIITDDNDTLNNHDEIIIRHKSNKDAKVTIEIRDNKVYVNGKPVEEFENDDLAIHKMKMNLFDGRTLNFSSDGMAMSPFRSQGGWSFDNDMAPKKSSRAFLGVTTDEPEHSSGARITSISDTSAAEKSGLKKGDIITKIDDMVIDAPQDLSKAIGKYKPGEKVTVTYKRDDKEQKVTATLGKTKNATVNIYGMGPDMLNMDLKGLAYPNGAYSYSYGPKSPRLGIKAQDTEDGKGVKVLNVDDESNAAKAGVKEGDIITRFDNTEVNNTEVLAHIAALAKSKSAIHVSLLRDGKPMELEIKVPRKLKTTDL